MDFRVLLNHTLSYHYFLNMPSKPKLLIVEDEQAILHGLMGVFVFHGYQVVKWLYYSGHKDSTYTQPIKGEL